MLKFNKVIKITVALLLSLVLVTSCLVSGVFARYVVKGTATASIKLKGFDFTITPGTDLKTTYSKVVSGNSVIVVSSSNGNNIIVPGTKGVLASFTVTGSTDVNCDVKIDGNIDLEGGYASIGYMPIIFKLCVTENGTRMVKEMWRMINDGEDIGKKQPVTNYDPDRTNKVNDITTLISTLNGELDEDSTKNDLNESLTPGTVSRVYSIEWEWFYKPVSSPIEYNETFSNSQFIGHKSFAHSYQTTDKDTMLGEAIHANPSNFNITTTMSIKVVQSAPTTSTT